MERFLASLILPEERSIAHNTIPVTRRARVQPLVVAALMQRLTHVNVAIAVEWTLLERRVPQ